MVRCVIGASVLLTAVASPSRVPAPRLPTCQSTYTTPLPASRRARTFSTRPIPACHVAGPSTVPGLRVRATCPILPFRTRFDLPFDWKRSSLSIGDTVRVETGSKGQAGIGTCRRSSEVRHTCVCDVAACVPASFGACKEEPWRSTTRAGAAADAATLGIRRWKDRRGRSQWTSQERRHGGTSDGAFQPNATPKLDGKATKTKPCERKGTSSQPRNLRPQRPGWVPFAKEKKRETTGHQG